MIKNKLVEAVRKYIGILIYLYGAEGQECTPALIGRLSAELGASHYDHVFKRNLWGKRGTDCSGLIYIGLKDLGFKVGRLYSNGLCALVNAKPIGKNIPKIGDLVFKASIVDGVVRTHHVAVVCENGKTIEAMDKEHGVCYGTVRGFNYYGTLPYTLAIPEEDLRTAEQKNVDFMVSKKKLVRKEDWIRAITPRTSDPKEVFAIDPACGSEIRDLFKGLSGCTSNLLVDIADAMAKTVGVTGDTLIHDRDYWIAVMSGKRRYEVQAMRWVFYRYTGIKL